MRNLLVLALTSVFLSTAASAEVLVSATFDADEDGFVYVDDPFLGTSNPNYADGSYDANGGDSGGGLYTALGGVDFSTVTGISGGWSEQFTLTGTTRVRISLAYAMFVTASFEPDECSRLYVSVDGTLVGPGPDPYIVEACGNGTSQVLSMDGDNPLEFEVDLPTGAHTLVVGGWLSKKNSTAERTDLYIDNVEVESLELDCSDSIDNDSDGQADCADAQCIGEPNCVPQFTDATVAAGVGYTQSVSPSGTEVMTGGGAVGDYDGDGLDDLYVTRHDNTDILFRNLGDGTFQNVTAGSGLDTTPAVASNGAGFADLDNDGDQDLYVTTCRDDIRHYLYINNGDGTFTEEAALRGADLQSDPDPGLAETIHGFSVDFGDYDRDGWLDIYVTDWRNDAFTGGPIDSFNRLLRNQGPAAPGHFVDVTNAAGVNIDGVPPVPGTGGEPGTYGFGSAFADLDDDGWPDLAVTADYGASRLFWNNGDGTFLDGTAAAGVGTGSNEMGSTFGDYDNDGDLDWFLTSIYEGETEIRDGNRLYRYDGGRAFTDVTSAAGVRHGFFGWGTVFFDSDNDGDLDLVHTNGFTEDEIGPWGDDPMRFFENTDPVAGTFTESAILRGFFDERQGKGLLALDYDVDGDVDVFVINNNETPVLYRNDYDGGNSWLRVRVEGSCSNRDGHGAKVRVTEASDEQLRVIGIGSHYLGQSERVAHFGLGSGSGPVDTVEITWPTGIVQTFQDVARNTTLMAVEPNPDQDADGAGDACDNCPVDPNPGQGIAVLGQSILAESDSQFCWGVSEDRSWVRGDLANVASYAVDVTDATSGTCLTDAAAPAAPGQAFYYLVAPACSIGSWQTSLGAQPDRDLNLP